MIIWTESRTLTCKPRSFPVRRPPLSLSFLHSGSNSDSSLNLGGFCLIRFSSFGNLVDFLGVLQSLKFHIDQPGMNRSLRQGTHCTFSTWKLLFFTQSGETLMHVFVLEMSTALSALFLDSGAETPLFLYIFFLVIMFSICLLIQF